MFTYIWLALLLSTISVGLYFLINRMLKNRFRITKSSNKGFMKKWYSFVVNHPKMLMMIDRTTFIIYKMNGKTLEKNSLYAVGVLIGILVLFIITALWVIITSALWYLIFLYILIIYAIYIILLMIIISSIEMKFNEKLPLIFKLIASRFLVNGKIIDAIEKTIPDSPSVMRKLLTQISEVLQKNDLNKINGELRLIEEQYGNQYVTVLLTIVKMAYIKGGEEAVKYQFEELTEDVLTDIENEKDVRSASRSFMLLAIVTMPPFVIFIENFGMSILGEFLKGFYNSPLGYAFKLILYFLTLAYVICLKFMESNEPK